MEEDIKILEEKKDKFFIILYEFFLRREVKPFEEALERLLQEYKEDEAVIDEMAKFMNNRSWKEHQIKDEDCNCCKVEYSSDKCTECIKEYFRKKVKDERDKV